jgi:hypothetical protein
MALYQWGSIFIFKHLKINRTRTSMRWYKPCWNFQGWIFKAVITFQVSWLLPCQIAKQKQNHWTIAHSSSPARGSYKLCQLDSLESMISPDGSCNWKTLAAYSLKCPVARVPSCCQRAPTILVRGTALWLSSFGDCIRFTAFPRGYFRIAWE